MVTSSPAMPVLVRWRPGGWEAQRQLLLHSEFEASWGYMRLSQTRKRGIYNEDSVESSGRLPALCSVRPCEPTVKYSLPRQLIRGCLDHSCSVRRVRAKWSCQSPSLLHSMACAGCVMAAAPFCLSTTLPPPQGFPGVTISLIKRFLLIL